MTSKKEWKRLAKLWQARAEVYSSQIAQYERERIAQKPRVEWVDSNTANHYQNPVTFVPVIEGESGEKKA